MPARRGGDGLDATAGCWGPRVALRVPRKECRGGQQSRSRGASVISKVGENPGELWIKFDRSKQGEEVELRTGEVEGLSEICQNGSEARAVSASSDAARKPLGRGSSKELAVARGAGGGIGEDTADLARSDGETLFGTGLTFAPKVLHPLGLQTGVSADSIEDRGRGTLPAGYGRRRLRHSVGLGHGVIHGICTHQPGGASISSDRR